MTGEDIPSNFLRGNAVPLNWKILAGIDVDRVSSGGLKECSVLQDALAGVAFCRPEEEFQHLSPEALKVFKVSQLLIRYLLHSQERLAEAVNTLQKNNERLKKEYEVLTASLKQCEKERNDLRLECKSRRRMIEVQQNCIYKGRNPQEFQKCRHCPKTFVNKSFLLAHLARRHREEEEEEGGGRGGPKYFSGWARTKEEEEEEEGIRRQPSSHHRHRAPSLRDELEAARNAAKRDERVAQEQHKLLVETLRNEMRELRKEEGEEEERRRRRKEQEERNGYSQLEGLRERLKRQEEEMANLKEEAHREALAEVQARLSSQELFWQAQLRSQADRYKQEVEELKARLEKVAEKGPQETALTPSQPPPPPSSAPPTTETGGPEQKREIKFDEFAGQGREKHVSESEIPLHKSASVGNIASNGAYENVFSGSTNALDRFHAIGSRSNISRNHEYASLRSLAESYVGGGAAQSVEDLAEENPSFLRRYRIDVKAALAERLEEVAGVEEGVTEIGDGSARQAVDRLAEDRRRTAKKLKNFLPMRKKCKAELLQMTRHASLKQRERNSVGGAFGTRMNSLRNSLLRGWRRRKREERLMSTRQYNEEVVEARERPKVKWEDDKEKMEELVVRLEGPKENDYVEEPRRRLTKAFAPAPPVKALDMESFETSDDDHEDEYVPAGRISKDAGKISKDAEIEADEETPTSSEASSPGPPTIRRDSFFESPPKQRTVKIVKNESRMTNIPEKKSLYHQDDDETSSSVSSQRPIASVPVPAPRRAPAGFQDRQVVVAAPAKKQQGQVPVVQDDSSSEFETESEVKPNTQERSLGKQLQAENSESGEEESEEEDGESYLEETTTFSSPRQKHQQEVVPKAETVYADIHRHQSEEKYVSSTISDTEEDDDYEYEEEEEEEESPEEEPQPTIDASKIKLKSPQPGSRIADLKNTIELQLRSRGGKTPPAGGVDTVADDDDDDWSIGDVEAELDAAEKERQSRITPKPT